MNATEAALMAREHLCRVPGMHPYLGFEVIDTSRFDFKEWEIECSVFSTLTSKMVKYLVVISDDKVQSSTEWIE
jgi:hypothetical protein